MNHTITFTIIFLLFPLSLTQCSDSKKADSLPPAKATIPELKPNKFKTTIQPLPAANRYQVLLEWESPETEPEAWVIHREDTRNGIRPLTTVKKEKRDYLDTDVVAGETYQYYFSTIETSDPTLRSKTTVTIPRDWQIDGVVHIREATSLNRLFLTTKSEIISDGELLVIQVNEILSQGATIQSFAANAESLREGRAGGTLAIRAKSGNGVLHVIARGENGAPGKTGSSGSPGLKGAAGKNAELAIKLGTEGVSRKLWEDIVQRLESLMTYDDPKWSEYYECRVRPTDGLMGGVGGDGDRGGDGTSGGNAARVYLEIQNPAAILVDVISSPGRGGEAGSGGRAGDGGPGGEPGQPDVHRICTPGKEGPPGPFGKMGPPGERGLNGFQQPLCLKLGDATQGDCEGFSFPGGKIW